MRIDRRMLRRWGVETAWLLCAVGMLAVLFAAFDRDSLRHVPRAVREAVDRAAADPAVRAALGAPVEATWHRDVSIDIDLRETPGRLRLRVRLSGSRRDGVLRVEAHRRGSLWRLDRLVVEPEGAPETIELR